MTRVFSNKVARLATFSGLILASGMIAFHAQAGEWDKKTSITIDKPIQVADTYLEPGTYVFRLLDSSSDRHVVQIFDSSETHIINTVLATPNWRITPTGGSRFLFWETPQGSANALRAWFYPGDGFGQEFARPKHLRTVAVASSAVVSQSPLSPEPVAAVAPPVQEQPAPQAVDQPVIQETQPAEVAQLEVAQNAPPAPPETVAEPAPPADLPRVLPKTASTAPLFGLVGLFAFGLYGMLRRFA